MKTKVQSGKCVKDLCNNGLMDDGIIQSASQLVLPTHKRGID